MTSLLLHKAGTFSCTYHALTGYGFDTDISSCQPAEYYRQELDRLYDEIYHKSLSSTDADERSHLLHILYSELVDLFDEDTIRKVDDEALRLLPLLGATYPSLRLQLDICQYAVHLPSAIRQRLISSLPGNILQGMHHAPHPSETLFLMASLAVEYLTEYGTTLDQSILSQLEAAISDVHRLTCSAIDSESPVTPSNLYAIYNFLYMSDSGATLQSRLASEARRLITRYPENTLEWWQCQHILAIERLRV